MFIKLFIKDLKAGNLNVLLLALVLAAVTVNSIALTVSAINNTIDERATHLLAADAQIVGSRPIEPEWMIKARDTGLNIAQAIDFRAMVFTEELSQVFAVKAVSNVYPLKGEVELIQPPRKIRSGPAVGEIFAPSALLQRLSVKLGDRVAIGDGEFTVAAELGREPDNLRGNFGFAPRLLMHWDDVPKTGAVQLGSRIQTTLYLSGSEPALEQFSTWVTPKLGEHFRWNSVDQVNRGLVQVQDKAKQFSFLAIILTLLLTGVAIGLGTRKYAIEHIQSTAVLKTLGWGPPRIGKWFVAQIHLLAGLGICVGLPLGYLSYQGLRYWIVAFVPDLQAASLPAYGLACSTVYFTLLAFALPYFLRLYRVSPLQVLRESHHKDMLDNRLALLLGFGTLGLLGALVSGQWRTVLYLAIALSLCFLGNALMAQVISLALFKMRKIGPPAWALGCQQVFRHRWQNAPQIAMFSILFTLMGTMVLLRTSLLTQWQQQIPADAPNYFVFNIFAAEKSALAAFFLEQKMPEPTFYPMQRARILGVDDQSLQDLISPDQHGMNYEREMNVTWSAQMGADNTLLEGEFWPTTNSDLAMASLEQKFAEGLHIELGDILHLSVASRSVDVKVTSIRQVQWDSFNPNFFIILDRPLQSADQANWLTSFYLADDNQTAFNQWLRNHPTVTVVEIKQTLKLMQEIIDQISLTIEFIGILVVLAGLLILLANTQVNLYLRMQEGAILRVLGAQRRLMRNIFAIEALTIGAIAALLACFSIEISVNLIAYKIFSLPMHFHVSLWLLTPLIMIPSISGLSLWATRQTVRLPPLTVLRNLR